MRELMYDFLFLGFYGHLSEEYCGFWDGIPFFCHDSYEDFLCGGFGMDMKRMDGEGIKLGYIAT